jgi:predicted helicase
VKSNKPIKKSEYDCYLLDEMIQYSSKKCNLPYEHYNGTGGDEHYYFDNIENLMLYFDNLDIEYYCEEIDVDHLRKEIKIYDKNNKICDSKLTNEIKKMIVYKILEKNNEQSINFNPNDQQLEILNKVEKVYSSSDILKLIWSCGLGKTLLSILIAKKLNHNKIVIGVPSVFLQKQFLNEIIKIYPNKNNILCIGGSEQSTTDPGKILSFMNKKIINKPIFIITTYCSCHLLIDNHHFDFKIGDEAHHLVGVENDETKNYKLFHKIKSNKTLFMTATEKSIDIKKDKEVKEVYSMDDIEKFGGYLDVKTVRWAIENKKITDYSLLILSNTENEINEIIKELKIQTPNKELFMSAFMSLKAIEKYKNLSHILICCNKTESADIISNYIDIILDKKIFNIDKKQFYNNSLHTNKKINIDLSNDNSEINKFKKCKYGIISSVYIFGEGFDLPKLNGVVFAENMVSDIRIVQTALRPNRLDSNNINKIAYIIIPYRENNDIELDKDAFNRVSMIISKLRNVDEIIEQKIHVFKIKKYMSEYEDNQNNHIYDFEDDNHELNKIKLRLKHSHALGSLCSEEQDEYNYVKQLNRELNIQSKEIYSSEHIQSIHKNYIETPDDYFKLKGVWENWCDFIGIDTSKFIKSKHEWIKICKEKSVISLDNYDKLSDKYDFLPKEPGEFYKEFTGIPNELGFNKKRRDT